MKKRRKKITKAPIKKKSFRANNLMLVKGAPIEMQSDTWWRAKYEEYKHKYRSAENKLIKHGVSDMAYDMFDYESFKFQYTAQYNQKKQVEAATGKKYTHSISDILVTSQKYKFSHTQTIAMLKDWKAKREQIEAQYGITFTGKADYVQIRSGGDEYISEVYHFLTDEDETGSSIMTGKEAKRYISETIFGSK